MLDRIASDEFADPHIDRSRRNGEDPARAAGRSGQPRALPLGDLRRRTRADHGPRARLPDDRAHTRVEGASRAALIQLLTDFLAERKLLLVLDNVEHLVEAAPAVAKLAATAPGLKILATSREPLHVSGEHVFPVPPLERARRSAAAGDAARSQRGGPSVRRAGTGGPTRFRADRGECASRRRASACRLDGLPLAIELAAARVEAALAGTRCSRGSSSASTS